MLIKADMHAASGGGTDFSNAIWTRQIDQRTTKEYTIDPTRFHIVSVGNNLNQTSEDKKVYQIQNGSIKELYNKVGTYPISVTYPYNGDNTQIQIAFPTNQYSYVDIFELY